MRKLTVTVPVGQLAELESITLVEAGSMPKSRPAAKAYKIARAHKARGTVQLKFVMPEASSPALAQPTMQDVADSPLARRRAALGRVFGILKGREDAPQDGLAFQLDMRAE